VSDKEKRVDPNATVQIDVGDLYIPPDPSEESPEEARPSAAGHRRTAPPPLPPMASVNPTPSGAEEAHASVPPMTSGAPPAPRQSTVPPPRGASRMLAYGVAFAVLLAGAIFGGLFAGRLIRGEPAPPQASVAPPPPVAPEASGSSQPLTLPAVEITGH
jgi:hypothetical protein